MPPHIRTRRDRVYSMRELNQRTAEVIKEINESGQPGVITRHGRFVALITPLANKDVEAAVLSAVLAAGGKDSLIDTGTQTELLAAKDLANDLDVRLRSKY